MDTAAEIPITLTAEDRALLIELLERERGELPAEIHHTRTTSVRQELRHRQERIDQLLARLRASNEP